MNSGGKEPGSQLSGRGEAKPMVQLRKLVLGPVYSGLRYFPPGRDWLVRRCIFQGQRRRSLFRSPSGRLATPTDFAARAGAETAHSLTLILDYSLGADHDIFAVFLFNLLWLAAIK